MERELEKKSKLEVDEGRKRHSVYSRDGFSLTSDDDSV